MKSLSFGPWRGVPIENVPESYLIWVCACYKGGIKAKHAGEVAWTIVSENDFIVARDRLKYLGYNTKGIWPAKDKV